MKKLFGFLVAIVLIINLSVLVYFINDTKKLHAQVSDINNIRVQLPAEFKDALLQQTVGTTKSMANTVLVQASKSISNELSHIGRENYGTIAVLTNGFNTVVMKLNDDVKSTLGSVNKICQEQEQKQLKRIKDAETAFSLYQRNPTSDVAVLYLQIAIRKNPAQLKYLNELRRIVDRSGLESGLVQEYQTMLSYCLDEITDGGSLEELAAMVRDLRFSVTKVEEEEHVAQKSEQDRRVKELSEEFAKGGLVVAFDTAAQRVAKRRMEVCRELMALESSDKYREEYTCADMITTVATMSDRIEVCMKNVENEISRINKMKTRQESELREVLIALDGTSVSQPIALACQAVQALYRLDMTSLPANIVEGCMEKIRYLDKRVQVSVITNDQIKADKIIKYVEKMDDEAPWKYSWIHTGRGQITEHLRQLDEQSKIVSKYIGTIVNTEIAGKVLDKQLTILEQSKEFQRHRLKEYQKIASDELKAIAKAIHEYKAAAWRQEFKKNQAEPLIERLMKIDSTSLVPEVNELYQYEYAQLMTDFNAWIEKEKAYEYKAEFMIKLDGIEKLKLEDL